ncbi:hypothetical protein [Paraburkholderia sp. C35]|uniref:hypothetical protein n=1 Tax=Paraburkholderia sp. C35 TaxID=2126993 RepID=UPI000D6879AE|nr:hypothetical protein [Paraburkholderia sp. C35]
MSRYFQIRITDPKTGKIFVPNYNGKPGFSLQEYDAQMWTYSSLYSYGHPATLASNNPNALQVAFDIPVSFMDAPVGDAYVRIDGVSLQEISGGANLNGMNFVMYGGMAKGLPLANPAQIGQLVTGQIKQCFGNWIDTEQYLMFYIQAGGSAPSANQVTGSVPIAGTVPIPTTNATPPIIRYQCAPGQTMQSAIVACLQTTYPQYSIAGSIDPRLVWSGTAATGIFQTLPQFANYIRNASLNLVGGYAPDLTAYSGVRMTLESNTITLFDGTAQQTPKQIYVTDLVGQPTLSEPLTIQATCVLRGDIRVGSYVALPLGQLFINEKANVGYVQPPPVAAINTKSTIAFQGSYMVSSVRHVGDSRNTQGTAWITLLDLLQTHVYDPKDDVYAQQVLSGSNQSAYKFFLPK